MLNPSDIYTSVGSTTLYGCWTPNVTKFDASSFYNWEQDNLPVYDLDERTSYLWERLGHPTSSVNGFALVVSADATSSCNSNIFTTLSGCLRALPEVINAPYIIEVASFGNLGSLILANKVFGPRGSIEIINRNFGKGYTLGDTGTTGITLNGENAMSSRSDGLASSIQINNSTAAGSNGTGIAIPSVARDFQLSKVYSLNQTVVSSTSYDSRLTGNLTLFTRKLILQNNRLTAALSAKNPGAPFASYGNSNTSALVEFSPYEVNAESYENIGTYDVSTTNEFDGVSLQNWKSINLSDYTASLAYGNKLKEIKVYNCNGPIYIRNFTVDGEGSGGREYGIDVRNSTVVLENCSVARCNKAGLYSENSDVILTRGFISYRNYPIRNSSRVGIPWALKFQSRNYYNNQKEFGAGIELVNSNLNFSSTYERDFSYSLSGARYVYTGLSSLAANGLSSLPASNWLFCLSRNDIGLKATNSIIQGGKNELNGYSLTAFTTTQSLDCHNLISELNTEAGVQLNNSKLEYSGRLNLFSNFVGLDCHGSDVKLDMINCRLNQKEGINLVDSNLYYNKDCYSPSINYADTTYKLHQISLLENGVHVKLIRSIFQPTDVSSIPTRYERIVASGSFGVENYNPQTGTRKIKLSPIIVDSNSKLRLISLGLKNNIYDTGMAYFGAAISITNNSEAILQGTKTYCTKLIGNENYFNNTHAAGVFVNNNSILKVQGPTVIAQFGVDALVDNNSKLEISPHRTKESVLDVSGFNLNDGLNHTCVELHSTRSCLVADNNSLITMEDLGDYYQNWTNGTYGTNSIGEVIDYQTQNDGFELGYANYTSGGSLQFYPNPSDYDVTTILTSYQVTSINNLYANNDVATNANGFNHLIRQVGTFIGDNSNSQEFSSVTIGGMCLRALNGSKVNVDNVHFPCGWWNPSSIIYDHSAADGNCSRLFIWNIADNSQLDAKLISVSGLHPADAAYFGPSGVWGSGAGAIASGAPSSTPNTSSISILDYYGRASGAHKYANTSATNQGPFRLYFSVDPVINWAVTTSGTQTGYARQVYAQGYQFSGNLLFSGTVSSMYKSCLKDSGANSTVASGFYYASSIVMSPFTTKALLDDSAANTFANAKHNSVGKSGLAKVVDIYYPYVGNYGGDSAGDYTKDAGNGIRSVNTFDLEKDN